MSLSLKSAVLVELNGDGVPDLSGIGDQSVNVSLGKADASFQAPTSIPVGAQPLSLAVGDLNGDGHQDLVAGNQGYRVLLGVGNGTFGTPFAVNSDRVFHEIALSDLNGDRKLDLIALHPTLNVAAIYQGRGDGTFEGPTDAPVGAVPRSMALGDFTGDGKTDLLVGCNGSSGPPAAPSVLSLLPGAGNGTFGMKVNHPSDTTLLHLAPGDFNNDGLLDVALVRAQFPSRLRVLLNRGGGTFEESAALTPRRAFQSVTIADLNRDGKLDLVAGDYSPTSSSAATDSVAVFLGQGNGAFSSPIPGQVGPAPARLFPGDFNRDGHPDLVAVCTGAVKTVFGYGNGLFGTPYAYAVPTPYHLDSRDMNGDGWPDLLVGTGYTATGPFRLANRGSGLFASAQNLAVGEVNGPTVLADMNGDGHSDLLCIRHAESEFGRPPVEGTLLVLLADGKGGFGPPLSYALSPYPSSLAIEDFNKDGKTDVAVTSRSNSLLNLLMGNGDGTLQPRTELATGALPNYVRAGDLNGDSHADLIVASQGELSQPGLLCLHLGNGDGTFRHRVDLPIRDEERPRANVTARGVEIEDYNGDGKPDLVAADSSFRGVYLFAGRGDGTFHAAKNLTSEYSIHQAVVRDMNGDRLQDLLLLGFGFAIFKPGRGGGAFGPETSLSSGHNSQSFLIEDVNRDGKPDLVSGSPNENAVNVLWNDTPPSFSLQKVNGDLTPATPSGSRTKPDMTLPARTNLNAVAVEVRAGYVPDGAVARVFVDGKEAGSAPIAQGAATVVVRIPDSPVGGPMRVSMLEASVALEGEKTLDAAPVSVGATPLPTPALRILRVMGEVMPAAPTGSATDPDVLLPANVDASAVPVEVEAENVPDGTVVKLLLNGAEAGAGALAGGKVSFALALPGNPSDGPIRVSTLQAVTVAPEVRSPLLSVAVQKALAGESGVGKILTVAGGLLNGNGDGGPVADAILSGPTSMARDSAGNLYVSEEKESRIRRITPEGIITTFPRVGQFAGNRPKGLAPAPDASLYLINGPTLWRFAPDGRFLHVAGTTDSRSGPNDLGDGGPASIARFSSPSDLAFDAVGNLYVADTFNHRVRKIDTKGVVTTVAGTTDLSGPNRAYGGFSGDGGPASQAQLSAPNGVTVDADGSLYIADTGNHRIRRIDKDGKIATVAGSGPNGYSYEGIRLVSKGSFSGDGGPATAATMNFPAAVQVDAEGRLYVADNWNHRIRVVSKADGTIRTVAGTGTAGYNGDGLPAHTAHLNDPTDLLPLPSGSLLIADTANDRVREVREGTLLTFAGGRHPVGDDEAATRAVLDAPRDVALDARGNLFIADSDHRRVRRLSPSGTITTVAGGGTKDWSASSLATEVPLGV
ncbi:MAG: VCBS repeat-containing protein, partial [Armatimonadetes bacterium]|nr:VCBS repeat-containing protein [Armatimonadota bacterium]